MSEEPALKGDIYTSGDAYYVIPTGTDLPAGELEIRGLDGLTLAVDLDAAEAFLVSEAQVEQLVMQTMGEVLPRVMALADAVGMLVPDGASGTADPLSGMLQWANQLDGMLKAGGGEALRARAAEIAAGATGEHADAIGEAMARLPDALLAGVVPEVPEE